MKKKTKELIAKIGIGLTALISGGILLFGHPKKTKKEEIIPKITKKDITDDLFI